MVAPPPSLRRSSARWAWSSLVESHERRVPAHSRRKRAAVSGTDRRGTRIGVRSQQLAPGPETTFALVFDKGDDPIAGITTFAHEHGITAAHFTGIGAFSRVAVGFFDRERRDYDRIVIDEQ